MSNPFKDIKDFQVATDSYIQDKPTADLPDTIVELRKNIMWEEFMNEFFPAIDKRDLAAIAQEGVDVIVTVIGTLWAFGIDPEPIWNAVHRANMAKVGPDGKVKKRFDGKVLKPEGWTAPDIEGELEKQKE
jgi:predicted HAD superfamily Cof-like phosphohydrolase